MFIFKNINLELKLALRTKYWFLQTLLYKDFSLSHLLADGLDDFDVDVDDKDDNDDHNDDIE